MNEFDDFHSIPYNIQQLIHMDIMEDISISSAIILSINNNIWIPSSLLFYIFKNYLHIFFILFTGIYFFLFYFILIRVRDLLRTGIFFSWVRWGLGLGLGLEVLPPSVRRALPKSAFSENGFAPGGTAGASK